MTAGGRAYGMEQSQMNRQKRRLAMQSPGKQVMSKVYAMFGTVFD